MDEKQQDQSRTGVSQVVLLTLTIAVVGGWLLLTPGGLLGKADAVGYAVCHRIDLRSFHLGERTLPLCSRCTGMYLGALFTLMAFVVLRGKAGSYPSPAIRMILILFAVLWALDGTNSFLSVFPDAPQLYPPQNWLRLVTGTLIGVSLATMIYPTFNQAAWRDWQASPVIPSWRWLMGLLLVLALLLSGVLSQNPLVLYPLAIISSAGVLVLLTMAYSVLTITLFKRQNLAVTWNGLWLPVVGALTLAFAQVAFIDLFRYVITGTWDGFHLSCWRRMNVDPLSGVFAAFGLSASAGLNAYIPLLILSLVARFTNLITLTEPWDALSSWWVIGVLIVLTVIEFFTDKIPAVNHINDVIQTFIRPTAGAIAFAASAKVVNDVHPALAIVAGLLVAGTVHAAKSAAVRPAVTATTGGVGNIPVSIAEDIVATVVSLLAIVIPVLILMILIVVTAYIIWRVWRRVNLESGSS